MQPVPIEIIVRTPIPVTLKFPDTFGDDGKTVIPGRAETYHLPYLGIGGLLPWLDEMTQARRKTARESIAAARLQPKDVFQAERIIAMDEAILADLSGPAQTPAGIERILRLSVEKSDVPPEKREEFIGQVKDVAYIAADLTQRLSTLFENKIPEPVAPAANKPAGGLQDPLAGGAEASQPSPDASAMTT